jgi:phage-related protein (TIGR01555 family)
MSIRHRLDSWVNVITGLGSALRDKREFTRFLHRARLTDTELDNLYHEEDIAARIAEALPAEALRRGYYLSSENDDPGLSSALAEYEKPLHFRRALKQAAIWARVFGGAVIYMGLEDGQPEDQPLAVERLQGIRFLQVLDRRYIYPIQEYSDQQRYGEPELYQIQRSTRPSLGSQVSFQPGAVIHESRLLRLDGALTSQSRMDAQQGWSDSVLERVHEVIRDFGSSWQAVGHLMQDAAQGVYSMRGLQDAVASGETDAILSRIQLIEVSRSVARAILLDAEEKFERQAYNFQGIPDILKLLMIRVAAAANMPVIILMRQSPSGLNATGDADIRLWYDQVQEYQADHLHDVIQRFYELVFAAQDFAGQEPDEWDVLFGRLWQMTDLEQAQLEKTVAEKDKILIDSGMVLPEELAVSRFKARGFSLDTQIDLDVRAEILEAELKLAKENAGKEPEPPSMPPQPGQDQNKPQIADGRVDKIEHRGSKWVVLSADGSKVLGTHDTKAEAEKQLRAIEAAKHRR